MAAAVVDIVVETGSLWERTVTVTRGGNAFDLSGYDARMMIREDQDDVAPLVSLTSNPADGITVNAGNTIDVVITPTKTDAIVAKTGWWDLEIYKNGDADSAVRVMRGRVVFSRQITR